MEYAYTDLKKKTLRRRKGDSNRKTGWRVEAFTTFNGFFSFFFREESMAMLTGYIP